MKIARTFLTALFGILGAGMGLFLLLVALGFVALLGDSKMGGAGVKLLPDEFGNRKELGATAPAILQLNIIGTIGKGDVTGKKVRELLLKSREGKLKNERVKAILLYIDSPGGGVNDADQIYRALLDYKVRYHVPVYAYADGMCASGGYMVALAADKIYTSDVSLVGSVGVLAWPPFLNVSNALDKLGIQQMTLFAGDGKDKLNPLRPWTDGEQAQYQKLINFYYNRFVDTVACHRESLCKEAVVKLGAAVFPAPEARDLMLTDGSGFEREEVLAGLAREADIPSDVDYQVISFTTNNFWKKAFSQKMEHHFSFGNDQAALPFRW